MSDVGTWSWPGETVQVTYSLAFLHEIDFDVNEGYRRIPRGGIETGGILFGHIHEDTTSIEASRPIECEHALGPSFKLTEKDVVGIRAQMEAARTDPDLSGLEPVGWFIGHTRSELVLTQAELDHFDHLFPGAGKLTLLVKPEKFKPTRFAFLVRQRNGTVVMDGAERAFILPLPGRPGAGPETVFVPPAKPLPAREVAPVAEAVAAPEPAVIESQPAADVSQVATAPVAPPPAPNPLPENIVIAKPIPTAPDRNQVPTLQPEPAGEVDPVPVREAGPVPQALAMPEPAAIESQLPGVVPHVATTPAAPPPAPKLLPEEIAIVSPTPAAPAVPDRTTLPTLQPEPAAALTPAPVREAAPVPETVAPPEPVTVQSRSPEVVSRVPEPPEEMVIATPMLDRKPDPVSPPEQPLAISPKPGAPPTAPPAGTVKPVAPPAAVADSTPQGAIAPGQPVIPAPEPDVAPRSLHTDSSLSLLQPERKRRRRLDEDDEESSKPVLRGAQTRSSRRGLVLLFMALLGCALGYVLYRQIPPVAIPVSLIPQSGSYLVTWPPERSRSADVVLVRVNDGEPNQVPAADWASGETRIDAPPGRIVKVELIIRHKLGDSRGIVELVR